MSLQRDTHASVPDNRQNAEILIDNKNSKKYVKKTMFCGTKDDIQIMEEQELKSMRRVN